MMCYKFLCTFNSSFVHIWFACQSGVYNFLTKVHMICLVAKRGQSRATKGHWKPLVKDLHNKTPPYKADRSRDWEKVKCHVYVMLPFRWLLFFSILFLVWTLSFTLELFVCSERAFVRHISFYLFGNISLTLTFASAADKLGPKAKAMVSAKTRRRQSRSYHLNRPTHFMSQRERDQHSNIPQAFMTFAPLWQVFCACVPPSS